MASGIHWRFWEREKGDCGTIEPLLSLYVDGMASSTEVRRVEAHLPGCDACRLSLQWMQATHQVIARRPVVAPPADMRARIARAIAEADAAKAPAPVAMPARPTRRPMTLRPALGYGLSVALFAAVSGTVFWSAQHSGPVSVKPVVLPRVASNGSLPGHAPVPVGHGTAFAPQFSPTHRPSGVPNAATVAARPPAKHPHLPALRPVIAPAPEEQTLASNPSHAGDGVTPPRLVIVPHPLFPRQHPKAAMHSAGHGGDLLAVLPKVKGPAYAPVPRSPVPTPPPDRTQVASLPAPAQDTSPRVSVAIGSPTVTPDAGRVASYVAPVSLNETLHRMVAANLDRVEKAPLTARNVILNGKNAVTREAADVTSSSSGTFAITEGPLH